MLTLTATRGSWNRTLLQWRCNLWGATAPGLQELLSAGGFRFRGRRQGAPGRKPRAPRRFPRGQGRERQPGSASGTLPSPPAPPREPAESPAVTAAEEGGWSGGGEAMTGARPCATEQREIRGAAAEEPAGQARPPEAAGVAMSGARGAGWALGSLLLLAASVLSAALLAPGGSPGRGECVSPPPPRRARLAGTGRAAVPRTREGREKKKTPGAVSSERDRGPGPGLRGRLGAFRRFSWARPGASSGGFSSK